MTEITSTFRRALCGVALALVLNGPALAQETDALVSVQTDWSVFNPPEEPKECFAVTQPKETVNTKDGQPVSVQRSEIRLFVTFRPGAGAAGEISFTGGYPFAPGSTVNVAIDGATFELFTDGEWGWPGSTTDDAALLAAMKKGTTAVMTAQSAKGTKTVDTFSLRGFTAALTEAEARCK